MPTPADPQCIFCKIAVGKIPCWKLYEDEKVLSFLDVGPLSEGHTLVIPKAHYLTLDQMDEDLVACCAKLLPRLGRAVAAVTGVEGWNVLQNNGRVAGQVVEHVHFHIIPRRPDDGLGYRWPAGKLAEPDARRLQAQMIARL